MPSIIENYSINNAQAGYPLRTLDAPVEAKNIESFAANGFHVITSAFDLAQIEMFRVALANVVADELYDDPLYQNHEGSRYYRWLMTKDIRFLALHDQSQIVALSQAMLGPQIRLDDADARVVAAGAIDAVCWHIHLRVVPEPLPPFFCYPHAIHSLTYLDDVGEDEGALCVLPGSHRNASLRIPDGDHTDRDGQLTLYPRAGDTVLIHCNLWHRTLASRGTARERRLLLSSIGPAWMRVDHRAGVRGDHDFLADRLAAATTDEERERYGGFSWS